MFGVWVQGVQGLEGRGFALFSGHFSRLRRRGEGETACFRLRTLKRVACVTRCFRYGTFFCSGAWCPVDGEAAFADLRHFAGVWWWGALGVITMPDESECKEN
jgi:hypothetical protein